MASANGPESGGVHASVPRWQRPAVEPAVRGSDNFSLMDEIRDILQNLQAVFCLQAHERHRIPAQVLQNCKGLCFMLTRKTGLGLVSVSSGTGFVIAKLDDPAWPSDKPCPTTRWSGPVAVRVAVLGLGLEVGESETFHILVLNSQRALETFSSGKLDLGTNISNAGGPTATEVSAKFHLGKGGVAATFEYCYAEGNLLGATLTGGFVTPVRSRNRKFYGEDYAVKDILAGHVGADQWMRFPPLKELYETINTAEQGAGIDTDGNESRPSE